MTPTEEIYSEWFVKPNDLVGGWCIVDVDQTPAESGRVSVANFLNPETATHIVALHNHWLGEIRIDRAQR